jgi:hypothetical protein
MAGRPTAPKAPDRSVDEGRRPSPPPAPASIPMTWLGMSLWPERQGAGRSAYHQPSLPDLIGQSSMLVKRCLDQNQPPHKPNPGQRLLDHPVKPGDDEKGLGEGWFGKAKLKGPVDLSKARTPEGVSPRAVQIGRKPDHRWLHKGIMRKYRACRNGSQDATGPCMALASLFRSRLFQALTRLGLRGRGPNRPGGPWPQSAGLRRPPSQ